MPNPFCRIGRNRSGQWVVQDRQGLYGGLFVNRTEALRYARLENGNRPCAVIMVPGVLELDLQPHLSAAGPGAMPARRVA